MSLAKVYCPDSAEIDRCYEEATRLLREAEARLLQIHEDEACEGVRRTALDLVAAMNRVHRMIEDYRDALARNAVALPRVVRTSEPPRAWSFRLWLRARRPSAVGRRPG